MEVVHVPLKSTRYERKLEMLKDEINVLAPLCRVK